MSDQSQPTESTDPRLQAALREYLERIDRGEAVNREEFLARHSEIADALRSFFAAEEPLRKVAATKISNESAAVSTQSIAAQGQETVPPGSQPARTRRHDGKRSRRVSSAAIRSFGRSAKGRWGRSIWRKTRSSSGRSRSKRRISRTTRRASWSQRFYREARAAATLRHANICPVYDVGEIDGKHFISMAYIEGRPLSDLIHGGKPQNERQILIAIHKLALACSTPTITGSCTAISSRPTSWSTSRASRSSWTSAWPANGRREGDASLTHSGMILGSPAYMSPEQIEGDPDSVGPASDQYSLGVVLYEMLTGQLPFRGSVMNVLAQIITKDPTPPSELRPGLDPRIEAICLRMMAKQFGGSLSVDEGGRRPVGNDRQKPAPPRPRPASIIPDGAPTASRPAQCRLHRQGCRQHRRFANRSSQRR